jgi:hypothetical protein
VLLGERDSHVAVGGSAGAGRVREALQQRVLLPPEAHPVVLAVVARAPLRLLPGVRAAPALLGLGGVPPGVVVAEDLEHLLRRQLDAHPSCLPRPVQCVGHRDEPPALLAQPVRVLAQQRARVDVVVEQRADLLERQPERAVGEQPLQPREVRVVVDAVAGRRPRRRHEQPERLPVVQRAHGRAGRPRDLPDRPARHGDHPAP